MRKRGSAPPGSLPAGRFALLDDRQENAPTRVCSRTTSQPPPGRASRNRSTTSQPWSSMRMARMRQRWGCSGSVPACGSPNELPPRAARLPAQAQAVGLLRAARGPQAVLAPVAAGLRSAQPRGEHALPIFRRVGGAQPQRADHARPQLSRGGLSRQQVGVVHRMQHGRRPQRPRVHDHRRARRRREVGHRRRKEGWRLRRRDLSARAGRPRLAAGRQRERTRHEHRSAPARGWSATGISHRLNRYEIACSAG